MTALAVNPALPSPGPAPVAAKSDADSGFSNFLNHLHDSRPAEKPKDEPTRQEDNTEPAASTAMQSLEAALASLAALSTPPAKAADPQTQATAATLDETLSAAASALEATGWDASGKTPLKALLESDPSLGLTDFQIKTFLAAAGATPAKTGATPLGSDSAWSPLEAAKAALAAAAPATGDVAALSEAALPARLAAEASRAAGEAKPHSPAGLATSSTPRPPGLRGLSPAEFHGLVADVSPSAAGSNAGTASDRGAGDSTNSDSAPTAAVQAAAADAPLPAPVSVAFASLPNFIAEQAEILSKEAEGAASTSASAAQTPKAAQAVKELHISLDPGDLGEMTLKLRLTGGKLSVVISVANPSTLSAIEDDRNLITARLASGDQSLEALTIQRQNPSAAAQPETQSSNGFATRDDSQKDSSNRRTSDGEERPKPPRRGGAGGAFSDFVV